MAVLLLTSSCGIFSGVSDFNNVYQFSVMITENNETISYDYYKDEDSLIKSRMYFNGEFYSCEEIARIELTDDLKAEVKNQCKKIQNRCISPINDPESIYSYDYCVIITPDTGNTRALLGKGELPKYMLDLLDFYKNAFSSAK